MHAGRPCVTDSLDHAGQEADGAAPGESGQSAGAEETTAASTAAALSAEGRHEEAEAACRAAIESDPGGSWAERAQRAAALEALGRHAEAQKECQKALKAPGESLGQEARLDATVRLGRLYIGAGKAAKAANHFAKEFGKSPAQPVLLAYRGLALVLDDRHGEALAAIGSAPGPAGDDPAVLAVEARALYETGRYGEAAERCSRACRTDPECSAAWLYAGMSRDAEGREEEARESYKRAAEAGGSGRGGGDTDMAASAGAAGRAHALCRIGRHAEAAELIAPAADASPRDARVQCAAGTALAGCGREGEAAERFRAAASSRPSGSDGLYYAALASCALGAADGEARRYDEAARHLRTALSRNKESARAAALAEAVRESRAGAGAKRRAASERIAREKIEAERREAAEAAAARRRPPGGARRAGKEGALEAEKKREKRRKEAERREEARAAEAAARAEAVGLSRDGRFRDAIDRFDRNAALRAGDSEGWDARARALYGLGRYDEAARGFKAARPDDPDNPDALAAAAAAAARQARRRQFDEGHTAISNYNDALYKIEKALERDPGHHEALVLAGTIHAHSANIKRDMVDTSDEKALDLFGRALEADPRDAQAQYYRGRILEKSGGPEEARAAYGEAAECRARRLEDHFCIGRSLDALGRFGEARAHYLEGMRLDPDLAGLCGEIEAEEGGGADGPGAAGGWQPQQQQQQQQPSPQRRDRSGLAVADTNVAMPCVVGVCAEGCDLPDDIRAKSYFAGRFAGMRDDGGGWGEGGGGPARGETIIVPWVCRGEILSILPGILSRLKCHESHGDVIARVKDALGGMPPEWKMGFRVGYADSLRVIKMYWRAWFRMSDDEKGRWQDRKRANGRLAGGGPPEGAVDTKVLALASKIAAEQSRTVVLYSCDEDFGAFSRHIAGMGVRVQPV